METTVDGLLNNRVKLEQPSSGYRVAVDTVLLAAAVPALSGDRVLDLGCGAGGGLLCLACRAPTLRGVGLEVQAELADLCRRNIERNPYAKGFEARVGDATILPEDLKGGFDHVLMNPPFHEEARHDVSPDKIKKTANTEREGDLAKWVISAAAALKPSGTLSIIHRADREGEILFLLKQSFGDVEILPLLPKKDSDAKRVILRARTNGIFVLKRCKPLVLHQDSGSYTPEADALLRGMNALLFTAL